MAALPKVLLKKGREKPILRGHPWVFSGAVERVEGDVSPGEAGEVYSSDGQYLGAGHLNLRSQIVFRLLTQKKEELGPDFYRERILTAAALRRRWWGGKTSACRIINAEGDFLPGLIVDNYGETLVLQCLTAGMERVKELLTRLLAESLLPQSIYERSDVIVRKEEGLAGSSGLLYGKDVPGQVEIEERGCSFRVNIKRGQKTGFYLDQRENRMAAGELSDGKRVLDCFCYTGAFAIHTGSGGAKEVTLIDSSEEALEMAEGHFSLNRLVRIPRQLIRGDAFEILRTLKQGYDMVILDPPPFVKKKGQLPRATRGYKDLNLLAFRLLNKGGILLTFSCSHHMDRDLFQKVVFSAAVDAGKKVQFLSWKGHPMDHPVNLSHPEGEYLKGLVCRVL